MAIKTILVEDNEKIRTSLIPTMRDLAGVDVMAFADTQDEAQELLKRYPDTWQLLVVDLFLLGGSGLGVLRSCRNRREDQVVLVLTNYPTAEIRRQCAELGADGVFDKSMELDAFFERCMMIQPNGTSHSHVR